MDLFNITSIAGLLVADSNGTFNDNLPANLMVTELNDTLNDTITSIRIQRPTTMIVIPSLAIFLVCLLGLPGNLFVLAVYLGKMTSSTRAYMFALAVADSAVCFCGIILTRVFIGFIAIQVIVSTIDVAITFSVYLLVFVAIERLLAVKRPHTFSMDALRAKKALTVIFILALLVGAVMAVARLMRNTLLKTVFPMTIIVLCVITMAVCYTLMAITLLKKARDASRRTGVALGSNLQEPGSSNVPVSGNLNPLPSTSVGGASGTDGTATPSHAVKTTAKQVKRYKGVMVLFIITVVFVVCWMPQWLFYAGVPASEGLRRLFMLNSAVNPIIYGVMSPMFRADAGDFYGRVRSKLSCC